jgi:hypothetical protein
MGGGVGREEGKRVAAVGTGERWGSACEGLGLERGCDRCVGPGQMGCWGGGNFVCRVLYRWTHDKLLSAMCHDA